MEKVCNENFDAEKILYFIEKYEAISRNNLALNLRNAMKKITSTHKLQEYWLAELCGTKRDSVYAWLGPSRTIKAPLKVVVLLSLELNIPIEKLLEITLQSSDELRQGAVQRISNQTRIIEYHNKHPEKSVKEIAESLKISENAVRRHLKIYLERENGK